MCGAAIDSGLKLLLDRRLAARRRRRSAELAQHRFHLEGLDHVAWFDVVEVLQPDTAFVPGRHFAHVILEAAQRSDLTLPRDPAIAHQTRTSVARDLAIEHHR